MKHCITSSVRIIMLRNPGVLLHILFLKIGPPVVCTNGQRANGSGTHSCTTRVTSNQHSTPPFLLVSDLTRLPFIITGPPSREKRSGCKIFGCNRIEWFYSIWNDSPNNLSRSFWNDVWLNQPGWWFMGPWYRFLTVTVNFWEVLKVPT